MCGEYDDGQPRGHPVGGSPPHVWRILDVVGQLATYAGITSTLVENTIPARLHTSLNRDHLHTRGEYTK